MARAFSDSKIGGDPFALPVAVARRFRTLRALELLLYGCGVGRSRLAPFFRFRERALAEAEARRKAATAGAPPHQKEFQGPKGPEPTRYGDWERKGIASDF